MNYLLDKKEKRKKVLRIFLILISLCLLFYFRQFFYTNLSYVSNLIFRPFLVLGNSTGNRLSDMGSYFKSKENLFNENESLKNEIELLKEKEMSLNLLEEENKELKETLNRTEGAKNMVLGTILSKPKQSIYGTLLLDVGIVNGVNVGNTVFANGNIPIGRINEVYENSSKVILFSTPKEETEVSINNTYFKMIGRGGGNFYIEAPLDFELEEGREVTIPSIDSQVVARIESIISDKRDSLQRAILVSPVNISQIKFVQVER